MLKSTFKISKTHTSFQNQLYNNICEINGLTPELITSEEILNHNINGDFFLHEPFAYQEQLYKGIISYPYKDPLDKDFDDFSFFQPPHRNVAEEDINQILYYTNPKKTINLNPDKNNSHNDITDKINADKILRKLNIPVPNKILDPINYLLKIKQPFYAKYRRGSNKNGLHIISDLNSLMNLENFNDFLLQEEVIVPTKNPSFVRINIDFNKITSSMLVYSNERAVQKNNFGRILLNCHGFEHQQKLNKTQNKILNLYGGSRQIPTKLINYSKTIFNYTKKHGLHSMGIDYIFDTKKEKWLCTGDVNFAPGRIPYLMLEEAKGNTIENTTSSRAKTTAKYLSKPFYEYVNKIKNKNPNQYTFIRGFS
ncbi:hypothetical protein HN415_01045 [Candidatus Woesearchaeota archaeon]|jgi:hypothetical protein|nr:hypothetical protein [Candidatus Woesearchaeota archaeon]